HSHVRRSRACIGRAAVSPEGYQVYPHHNKRPLCVLQMKTLMVYWMTPTVLRRAYRNGGIRFRPTGNWWPIHTMAFSMLRRYFGGYVSVSVLRGTGCLRNRRYVIGNSLPEIGCFHL